MTEGTKIATQDRQTKTLHLDTLVRESDIRLAAALSSLELTERAHKTVAVADASGAVLACSQPTLLGNAEAVVASCRRLLAGPAAGEAVITNDPYSGSPHLQDHWLVLPVRRDDRVVGYAVASAHLADVGGGALGNYFPAARDLWQEGVVTTPVRVARADRLDRDVVELIKLNSRLPVLVDHDLRALYDTAKRLAADVEGHLSAHGGDELLADAESSWRAVLGRLALDTSRRLEGHVHNCVGPDALIALRLQADGDRLQLDFEGSSPEVEQGFINLTLANTRSAAASALSGLPGVVMNTALFRRLVIRAPERSVVNCSYPHPVGGSPHHPAAMVMGLVKDIMGVRALERPPRVQADRPIVVRVEACRRDGCPF
jgi:N-methylhydantoinase B